MPNPYQRTKAIRAMRGDIPSPGRPPVGQHKEKVVFWNEIRKGFTTSEAAIIAGISTPVGARWFRHAGGMQPVSTKPASGRYLSFGEREEIGRLRQQGASVDSIGDQIGRSPSTISRELRRNISTRSNTLVYKPSVAQWHAERRGRRPKESKLAGNDQLREYVQQRLSGNVKAQDGEVISGPATAKFNGRRHGPRQDRRWVTGWSPEQISARLLIDFPGDESMRISHEAIYQALFIEGRGGLDRSLVGCLRTGRALRTPRARVGRRGKNFVTPEVLIGQRGDSVNDREEGGHWEGDLIIGVESSAVGTLVERVSRFTVLLHLPRMPGCRVSLFLAQVQTFIN